LLTKWIFFSDDNVLKIIKAILPEGFRNFLESKEILTYMMATPILGLVVLIILRALLVTVYQNFLITAAKNISDRLKEIKGFWKIFINGLYQVPKSIIIIMIYSIGLSFYTYYNTDGALSSFMNSSYVYRTIYNSTLVHILSSNIAKSVPIIEKSDFGKYNEGKGLDFAIDLRSKANGKSFDLAEYLDGNSVEEVIRPIAEIRIKAERLTRNVTNDRQKALMIYQWVVNNIQYDANKGVQFSQNPDGIPVGASVAFTKRKGICFDYASLYAAMCESIGLKVRFVTGITYSGRSWGDHAWNEVYIKNENKWISVDTMFGKDGNYFDKIDFKDDHRDGEVRYESGIKFD